MLLSLAWISWASPGLLELCDGLEDLGLEGSEAYEDIFGAGGNGGAGRGGGKEGEEGAAEGG